MKISIIVPVYNSKSSLRKLNNEIDNFFISKNYEYEKIFVNDYSTDSSLNILKEIYKLDKNRVVIVDLFKNIGQQNALFAAMHYAGGDYIVTIDDDLQHNINSLEIMIDKVKEGNDLVYGIYANRYKNFRSLGSKITGLFFKINYKNLNGKRVSSYRIFSKELLKEVCKCKYRFIYISAIMLKTAASIDNVLIEQREREYGKSGYNICKLIKLFINLYFYYSKWIPDIIKPKNKQFQVKEVFN